VSSSTERRVPVFVASGLQLGPVATVSDMRLKGSEPSSNYRASMPRSRHRCRLSWLSPFRVRDSQQCKTIPVSFGEYPRSESCLTRQWKQAGGVFERASYQLAQATDHLLLKWFISRELLPGIALVLPHFTITVDDDPRYDRCLRATVSNLCGCPFPSRRPLSLT